MVTPHPRHCAVTTPGRWQRVIELLLRSEPGPKHFEEEAGENEEDEDK